MKIIEEYWRGDIAHDNCVSAVRSLAITDDTGEQDSVSALADVVGRLLDELVAGGMPKGALLRVLGSRFRIEDLDR